MTSSLLCPSPWPNNWPEASIPQMFAEPAYKALPRLDPELGLENTQTTPAPGGSRQDVGVQPPPSGIQDWGLESLKDVPKPHSERAGEASTPCLPSSPCASGGAGGRGAGNIERQVRPVPLGEVFLVVRAPWGLSQDSRVGRFLYLHARLCQGQLFTEH